MGRCDEKEIDTLDPVHDSESTRSVRSPRPAAVSDVQGEAL